MFRGVFGLSHSSTVLLLLLGVLYTVDGRVPGSIWTIDFGYFINNYNSGLSFDLNLGQRLVAVAILFHVAIFLLHWLDQVLEFGKSRD